MSTSGLSAFLSSEEAVADWNLLTNYGNIKPNDNDLTKWYNQWVDKWHGVQKDVVVKYLLADYKLRTSKLEELGREKFEAWLEEVREQKKAEALAKMSKDIELGARDKTKEKVVVAKANSDSSEEIKTDK